MLKLLLFAVIVVIGQLIFKHVARGLDHTAGIGATVLQMARDPWFIAALGLYAGSTLLWVIALRETPLSRAYPFMALAFALVPIGAAILYNEVLGIRYFLGLSLIIMGIFVISADAKQTPKNKYYSEK